MEESTGKQEMGGGGGEVSAEEGRHQSSGGPAATMNKGKSCKGCLYYSSLLKSKTRNPVCAGISRTLQQVPGYIVGESEMEASKEGRSLSNFKYACVGYSVFLDNKDTPTEKREKQAELPFCVGIELLVDRVASTPSHVPAQVHNQEDGAVSSQPRLYKPAQSTGQVSQSTGQVFFNKFTRNAGLVASGVARNLNRVGHYIKDNLDDILYPYRRRPK